MNNGDAKDRLGIAKILNDFFSIVEEKLAVKLSRMNNKYYSNHLSCIHRDHNRFLISPVNDEQIVSIIKRLKSTEAVLDDIPLFVFK